MNANLQAVVVTDVGKIRSNNEDLAYAGHRLFVIADGMGGPPAGDLASEIMIETLRGLDDDAVATGYDAMVTLRDGIDAANLGIFEAAEEDAGRQGMGTTVTGLLCAEDGTFGLVHVGDSRGYLLRDGVLTQITIDDTYVQLLIDQGSLDPADARHHPQRAIVTQAVQGGAFEPHCSVLEPLDGDRYLLCSDGLSDVITDETIATALGNYDDPLECGQRLVKLTLAAGAPDNVTVVLVDFNREISTAVTAELP
jgi:PPM family protein phosphatase